MQPLADCGSCSAAFQAPCFALFMCALSRRTLSPRFICAMLGKTQVHLCLVVPDTGGLPSPFSLDMSVALHQRGTKKCLITCYAPSSQDTPLRGGVYAGYGRSQRGRCAIHARWVLRHVCIGWGNQSVLQ